MAAALRTSEARYRRLFESAQDGILIINAMQNFQIVLLWCAVLLAVGASLLIYGALTLVERAAYARFG